jgi:D-alanyl-D-alanine carboxypeptidase (penicillin-binding protein 5/6)
MLLPSGNDAAYILAEAAGHVMLNKKDAGTGAAVTRFVEEMNSQARLLGMTGTNFANPDGIHSDSHYTTYADLAIMGTLALEDPVIRKYALVSTETVTLASGEKSWKNTNALINPQSEYYCPYATGLKTGQTPRAGSCLLSSFEYHGHTLLIGVFGCPEADDRFPDTLQLFNKTAADLP